MFVVFDLDGTLADISHRVHYVRGQRRDWGAFFKECVHDLGYDHVIKTFHAHIAAGHKVRIWSARSDIVRTETENWLSDMGIDPCYLQHMRAAGDSTPDAQLKRYWLNQELQKPDIVYDDRQRVVDMWRSEGIACFQVVADWEDDGRKIEPSTDGPLLTLMVGPSGAGKSTYAKGLPGYISSDELRAEYTGDFRKQDRNEDVFTALHRIAKARLSSGLPVCIDATNIRRKDRLACVALAPTGSKITYVVVDRPLASKMADAGWRSTVEVKGKPLVQYHHEVFQSALRDIMAGDGHPNVHVIDLRSNVEVMAA